jgi:hypothetical protein
VALFREERDIIEGLLREWYDAVNEVTHAANGVVSERARQYDVVKPVWHRLAYPWGFLHEITKKTGRVEQLYRAAENGNFAWDTVYEELLDIVNYARFLAAIVIMLRRREERECDSTQSSRQDS